MKKRILSFMDSAGSVVLTLIAVGALISFAVWVLPPMHPADAAKLGYQKKLAQGIRIGSNGSDIDTLRTGSGAFSSGVLVVSATWVKADTRIFAMRGTVAGTSGVGIGITRTPGTSFTLTSQTAGALTTQTGDTSAVVWMAIDTPAAYPTVTPTATP